LFLFILISGCTKDVQLSTPIKSKVDTTATTTSSFPLKATTYGWEKIASADSTSYLAFDSHHNIYYCEGSILVND